MPGSDSTRKLVTSEKRKRAFVHKLTDAGVVRCHEELSAPPPDRAGAYAGVLYATLATVGRFLAVADIPMAEFFKPDAASVIEDSYRRLAGRPGETVRISALRQDIDDVVSRRDLDAELIRMADRPEVYLRAVTNQQTLTDDDRHAAVRLGDEDRHTLQIGAS